MRQTEAHFFFSQFIINNFHYYLIILYAINYIIFTKQIKAVATTMNNLVRLFQEKLLSKLTASNKLYKQVNHQKLEAKNQIRKDLSEL